MERKLSSRMLLGVRAEAARPNPMFEVLEQPFDTDAVIATLV